jgi:hypothetical protein
MTVKEKLYNYINSGDEKLVSILYAVAREYMNDDEGYEFSEEELKEFEDRRKKRISGESKTYSWQQAKEIITGK